MKAILPSLKCCFRRLVIKMWQAVADMSIQRHATRLIMFFNHRMEREQPTLGSLSTSRSPNGLKRVQLNPTFLTQERLRNDMWATAGRTEQRENETFWQSSSPTSANKAAACMHVALCTHAHSKQKKKKKERRRHLSGHCCK